MKFPTFKHELKYLEEGYVFVAGCDEVGRAPLAGPVVAAACILNPKSISGKRTKNKWYFRVRDSKTTSEAEREVLVEKILKNTLAYGIGEVWQKDIDKLNIHNASLLAMRLALQNMIKKMKRNKSSRPRRFVTLVDGRFLIPNLDTKLKIEQKFIVKGDSRVLSISAASIIAKVHRDSIMKDLHIKFPKYGFASHKGYPTKKHRDAIKKFGITPFHRKSFLK